MALKLLKGRPKAIAVPLTAGAVIFIRPATAFEVDLAAAGASKVLAGLVEGAEAAATALDILGDEFREADFTTRAWIEAAAQRLALLELATLCAEKWEGVIGDDDQPLTGRPPREHLARLLRDSECAMRIGAAVRARVHDEVAEGNGLAVSPNGAARAAEATAPSVTPEAAPAPTASAG